MPSHTASAIVVKTEPVTHNLAISGYSTAKNCYTNGTYIRSAKFVAGGRRWSLRFYPNGCCSWDNESVTFLLYHDRDGGADEDKVAVPYKVSLLGQDGNPVPRYQRDHTVTYDDKYTTIGLISRKCLEQPAYLSNDAFRVRCQFEVPIVDTEDTTFLQPSTEDNPTHVPVDVHDGLVCFVSNEVPTDVAFEVGDESFQAHRRFLAARSPVFAALFDGPMRENTAPSVRVDGMEPRVFKAMLDFIYRGYLLPPPVIGDGDDHDDPIAMAQQLIVAAERYDLERLKSICTEKLRRHINASTVATTLNLALRHGCHALKDACYDFLALQRGNLNAILSSEGLEQLLIDFPSLVLEIVARGAPSPR